MAVDSMLVDETFVTSRLNDLIGWARKYSIFNYPFVTACCGMEYMSASSSL
jgi:NADH-quinone oxidoreductase subunit B